MLEDYVKFLPVIILNAADDTRTDEAIEVAADLPNPVYEGQVKDEEVEDIAVNPTAKGRILLRF